MTREEFLAIPKLAREISEERSHIAVLRGKLYSPRGLDTSEKVQSSGSQTALADIVIDMEQRLDSKEAELDRMQEEAARIILGNDELTGEEIMLMLLRYTEGAKWETIADAIHYSPASVFRIHNIAIEKIFQDESI